MAQPTDYTTLEEGHYNTSRVTDRHTAAPNSPTLAPESSSVGGYQLRPKISLTPLGKKSPACNSIADARATHAPQPFQTPKKGLDSLALDSLADSLGGPVSFEDVQSMLIDDPSKDLSPDSPSLNFTHLDTPDIVDTRRYRDPNLANLLDDNGFSAPGSDALHLFTPNAKASSSTNLFTTFSPGEAESFFSGNSYHPARPSSENLNQDPDSGSCDISTNSGGRPTNHTQLLLNNCFRELDEAIRQTAVTTNRTADSIIDLWQQRRASKCQTKSVWNKYQRYFTDHTMEERQRVGNPKAAGKCYLDCFLQNLY